MPADQRRCRVALLAFMGQLVTEKRYQLVSELAPSLKGFVSGVIAVTIAHGVAYGANLSFYRYTWG